MNDELNSSSSWRKNSRTVPIKTIITFLAVIGSSKALAGSSFCTASALAGGCRSSFLKRNNSRPSTTNQATTTTGSALTRKSLNDRFAADPMSTLGGSPIRVPVPPVFDNKARAINNGTTLMPKISPIRTATGAMITTVVTLSRSIESTVVTVPNKINKRIGLPLDERATKVATYWKKPVGCRRATRVIIPRRRPIV